MITELVLVKAAVVTFLSVRKGASSLATLKEQAQKSSFYCFPGRRDIPYNPRNQEAEDWLYQNARYRWEMVKTRSASFVQLVPEFLALLFCAFAVIARNPTP
jgi:hypothetical protein